MKRNAITRILLYSILTIILTGILITGITSDTYRLGFGSNGGSTVNGEVKLDASPIANIHICWRSGTITICQGYEDTLTFYEILPEGGQERMTYRLDGDTLILDHTQYKHFLSWGKAAKKDLVICVPQDWQGKNLYFDGSSLEIQLQGLALGDLEVDGSSCKVNMQGTAHSIKMDGSSCQLQFTGSVEELEIDGSSCNALVQASSPIAKIQMDGSSCELELILPQDCGFTANLDGPSVKLHSDLPCVQKDGKYIYGDGYCKIELDGFSVSCTISVGNTCLHEWDLGEPAIVPGSNVQQWIFTCLHCGSQEVRDSRCEHNWIMVGSGLIRYQCSLCGECKDTEK